MEQVHQVTLVLLKVNVIPTFERDTNAKLEVSLVTLEGPQED